MSWIKELDRLNLSSDLYFPVTPSILTPGLRLQFEEHLTRHWLSLLSKYSSSSVAPSGWDYTRRGQHWLRSQYDWTLKAITMVRGFSRKRIKESPFATYLSFYYLDRLYYIQKRF